PRSAPVPTFEAPVRAPAPAHVTAWDTTTNLPPTALPSQAPAQSRSVAPVHAPAPRPVDPFALVASGGRVDAGGWPARAAPPPPAARKTPGALWTGRALLVGVGAFLVGMFGSPSSEPAPGAAPSVR